jgi:phosphoenolpyruvate carboxylase
MLPGWYGVGQAIRRFGDKGLLREMATRPGPSSSRRSRISKWCSPSPTWISPALCTRLVEDKAMGDKRSSADPRRLADDA